MKTFRTDKAFIFKHRAINGAWNRKQVEALGEIWPPPKGWIKRVAGRELTGKSIADFVKHSSIRA